jgi:hypothetical protein
MGRRLAMAALVAAALANLAPAQRELLQDRLDDDERPD